MRRIYVENANEIAMSERYVWQDGSTGYEYDVEPLYRTEFLLGMKVLVRQETMIDERFSDPRPYTRAIVLNDIGNCQKMWKEI